MPRITIGTVFEQIITNGKYLIDKCPFKTLDPNLKWIQVIGSDDIQSTLFK